MVRRKAVGAATRYIAIALQTKREQAGLTYDDLSERTGLSKSGVLYSLKGEQAITLEALLALCHALDLDPGVLLNDGMIAHILDTAEPENVEIGTRFIAGWFTQALPSHGGLDHVADAAGLNRRDVEAACQGIDTLTPEIFIPLAHALGVEDPIDLARTATSGDGHELMGMDPQLQINAALRDDDSSKISRLPNQSESPNFSKMAAYDVGHLTERELQEKEWGDDPA